MTSSLDIARIKHLHLDLPWLLIRKRYKTILVPARSIPRVVNFTARNRRNLLILVFGVQVARLSLPLLGLWTHFVNPLNVITALVEDSEDHTHSYAFFSVRKSLVVLRLGLVAVVGCWL